MTANKHLVIGYRCNKNMRDYVVRAKLPQQKYNQ